jgi:hypothetical protein
VFGVSGTYIMNEDKDFPIIIFSSPTQPAHPPTCMDCSIRINMSKGTLLPPLSAQNQNIFNTSSIFLWALCMSTGTKLLAKFRN